MDTDLRSDDIRPTDAACYLYAIENPLTGLSPAVAFAVDVEYEYVECSDDEEEWEEDVAVSVEWIPFAGRTWRDLVSLSLTDVGCYTDGTSPEPSVYYAGVHHRMGTLSVQVLGIAEAAGGSGEGGVGGCRSTPGGAADQHVRGSRWTRYRPGRSHGHCIVHRAGVEPCEHRGTHQSRRTDRDRERLLGTVEDVAGAP